MVLKSKNHFLENSWNLKHYGFKQTTLGIKTI